MKKDVELAHSHVKVIDLLIYEEACKIGSTEKNTHVFKNTLKRFKMSVYQNVLGYFFGGILRVGLM